MTILKITILSAIAVLFIANDNVSPCPLRTAETSHCDRAAAPSAYSHASDRRFFPSTTASVAKNAAPAPGYTAIGTAIINGHPFKVFSSRSAASANQQAGNGHGFVDVFDGHGRLIRRIATLEHSDSNWEMFEYIPVTADGSRPTN